MRISDALATQRPFFSFEFFPPKDDAGSRQLFATIAALAPLRPAFVSITYGAGGSTRARTVALAKEIQQQIGLTVVAHVTCVGANRAELRALFDDLARAGHRERAGVARRSAARRRAFEPPPGGFAHASELIAMLRRNYDFCIGAACYPEKHPEAATFEDDLLNAEDARPTRAPISWSRSCSSTTRTFSSSSGALAPPESACRFFPA